MSLPFNRSDFHKILTSNGIWIALNDRNIIGAVMFGRNDKENPPYIDIYGIRVDEQYRGRGIGGILLQKADMFARTNGIDSIKLQTSYDNIASLTLCKKAGYIVTENSGDKLILVKRIRFR